MTHVVADRVKETSISTGTGDFTLAGAATGFRAFSQACSVGDTLFYALEAVGIDGVPSGEWEVGFGTYSGANTLTRTTPLASSNNNAAVNFGSGTKNVWLDVPAAQMATLSRQVKPLTPASNAAIVLDWSYSASKITVNGTHVASLANVPTGAAGHLVKVDNFNAITWPAAVDWGAAGKPSIAGPGQAVLKTLDGGATVQATLDWRSV